ncbi:MAG: DUF5615 family PIN-like protein [Chloroflexi bacterium]|nr:DUF5615 family PIN-like protein [Chloroflexota bacterium]
MNFLLDESAEFRLAGVLKTKGHDVKAIAHDYSASLTDEAVLAIATREQRILITNDRDFGELIFRAHLPHTGVIYFRLSDQSLKTKLSWLERVLTEYADQLHRFLVVGEQGVRMR